MGVYLCRNRNWVTELAADRRVWGQNGSLRQFSTENREQEEREMGIITFDCG